MSLFPRRALLLAALAVGAPRARAQEPPLEPLSTTQAGRTPERVAQRARLEGARATREPLRAPADGTRVGPAPARYAPRTRRLDQWLDGPWRDQADAGTCHAFAAVALLEAGVFRQTGRKITLSEADLFAQLIAAGAVELFDASCGNDGCELQEGGWTAKDLRFALQSGVASSPVYQDFLERFRRFRARETATMREIAEDRSLIDRILRDPLREYRRVRERPGARRELARVLLQDQAAAAERSLMKEAFSGFRVSRRRFAENNVPASLSAGGAVCAEIGRQAFGAALAQIEAGRPAGLELFIQGLEGFGTAGQRRRSAHALVAYGWRRDERGRTTLLLRNSWGGFGDELEERHACRILEMIVLRAPADEPAR